MWNGAIDRRPEVFARRADAADGRAAILRARDQGLEISVRGGAPSASGACVGDGGLMMDLSGPRHVKVDPVARRALVGGVATLADRDIATQANGRTGGIVGRTGAGGLTASAALDG